MLIRRSRQFVLTLLVLTCLAGCTTGGTTDAATTLTEQVQSFATELLLHVAAAFVL